MTATAVTIRRARLSPQWAAAPGRAALQRWGSDIHLARYGLPPQAIVIVRRLQAPAAALHDARADPLASAFRGALRPALEQLVGAGVTAVWFADEAELLACLARDALGGELSARWWWPLLFARAPTPALALQRWVEAPQAVPWALHALADAGQGTAWLTHIGPVGRAELAQALARAYPVCEAVLAGVLERQRADGAARLPPESADAAPAWPGVPSDVIAADIAITPPAGPNAAQRLLRLAEVLRLTPECAASPGLMAELLVMREAPARPRRAAADGATRVAPRLAARAAAAAAWPPEAGAAPALQSTGAVERPSAPAAAGWAGQDSEPPPAHKLRPRLASTLVPQTAEPVPRRHAEPSAALRTPALQASTSFDTRYGGLAFLLNVALHLGLYGDFTRPLHPGLALSPWRLLHTALGAACGRASHDDPLRPWLHERGGGAPEPRLHTPWQLPGGALTAFDEDARPWHAVINAGQLQLWHPAGFCVAQHQPATGLPALLANLQRPQQVVLLHTATRRRRASRLPPCLSALVWPLLRARLALALGLPARAALALCLPLPAHVQASGERLDLHFSLAALPLAVRLAGLDRDPGWLPAAGSDIRFHFD